MLRCVSSYQDLTKKLVKADTPEAKLLMYIIVRALIDLVPSRSRHPYHKYTAEEFLYHKYTAEEFLFGERDHEKPFDENGKFHGLSLKYIAETLSDDPNYFVKKVRATAKIISGFSGQRFLYKNFG